MSENTTEPTIETTSTEVTESERPLATISSLGDARKKAEDEHAESILAMFKKEPALLKDAIIISPGIDSIIYPPDMSDFEVVGALEAAKMTVLIGDNDDDEEDDDEDDDD